MKADPTKYEQYLYYINKRFNLVKVYKRIIQKSPQVLHLDKYVDEKQKEVQQILIQDFLYSFFSQFKLTPLTKEQQ